MTNKFFGTVLIVAGTTIGASMLALPLKTAEIGFPLGCVFMVASWLFMLANAYIILLVTKPYSPEATFHTIVKDVFGVPGWLAMTAAMLWLFYALLAAYAAGASTLISKYLGGSPQLIGSLIFGSLAIIIVCNTQATDYMNRVFFTVKLVIFFLLLWPLMERISGTSFFDQVQGASVKIGNVNPISVLLIYLTSFGFHGSITSLILYNKGDRSILRQAFFAGTFLSVALYLVWILICLCMVGDQAPSLTDMAEMIRFMGQKTGMPEVSLGLNIFALLAVLTSFLGVGLGLTHYFQDMVSTIAVPQGLARGVLTFVPPYLIMMIDSSVFIQALEFAGVALIFIAVLMPNMILQRQISRGSLRCSAWVRVGSFGMILASLLLIPLYFIGAF